MFRCLKREWPLLVWCFLIFSFCGWLYELGWELHLHRDFVNYLNNNDFNVTYKPIYGFGGLILLLSIKDIIFEHKKVKIGKINITPVAVFVSIVFIATFVEYVSSCVIEDLYNVRMWDYSTTPYNLNGRIALKNSMIFGIIGMLGVYGILPFLRKFLSLKGKRFACVSAIVIVAVLVLDVILVSMGFRFII